MNDITGFNTELYTQVTRSLERSQVRKSDDGSIFVNLKQTSVLSFSQSFAKNRSQIGQSALSNALHHNLKVGGKQPELVDKAEQVENKPFDFNKVADNVMRFIGKTILDAKKDGASDAQLEDMFSQARRGIDSGFSDAKEELTQMGMLNEELEQGIDQAYDVLTNRLMQFEDRLFGREPQQALVNRTAVSSEVSHSESQNGDLTITTADGDVVTLSFENIESFSKRVSVASQHEQGPGAAGDKTLVESSEKQNANVSAFDQMIANLDDHGNVTSFSYEEGSERSFSAEEQYAFSNSDANGTTAVVGKMSYQHYESNNLAFSVEGELDEDELAAIGNLVNDLSSISDEFFNGDPMAAFEQALSIGYDSEELASFSMNLSSVETTRVTNVYQEVAQFAERPANKPPLPAPVAKPLQNYGQQMSQIAQQANEKLSGKEAVKELIGEVMNKQLELLKEQLEGSEERFMQFNQAILDRLLV